MAAAPVHILVIDDNEDILYMLQAMLAHKGYEVTVKDNTVQLESYITTLRPDIILMDMLLSGSDGRELCRQFKQNEAIGSIPLIMLSAHPHARVECLAAGANFFVEKPFEMNELFSTVSQAEKSLVNESR